MKQKSYVYAHINPHNNKVFYIGSCYSNNDRINDPKPRNKEWKKEVDSIGGLDKVIKKKIIEGDYTRNEIVSLEWRIGREYYEKGENYCCFEHNTFGENNPNYGNKWTEEQKQHMSEMQKGRYVGESNPNYGNRWTKEQREYMSKLVEEQFANGRINGRAVPVRLFLLDGTYRDFKQKKDMRKWCREKLGCPIRDTWPPNTKLNKKAGPNMKYNGMYYIHLK